MNPKLRANLLLLLTALIWGVAFVAQDVAMDAMPPFTFSGIRLLLAGVALLPCIRFLDRKQQAAGQASAAPKEPLADPATDEAAGPSTLHNRHTLLIGGVCCGLMLFLGTNFQQFGIQQTSAGKAGFVTALYIVLVPLAGLFTGKRVRYTVWLAVGLCTLGMFFLCVTESLTFSVGDLYLLLCAFFFTGHILIIDHFSRRVDCVRMSCLQFFVAAAMSFLCVLLFEKPDLPSIGRGIVPILYSGLFSGALGYTLQMLAQRDTDPTIASLILCLESVFAVLAGWLLLGDLLTLRELLGCGLMLCGIFLAQWPQKRILA